MPSEQVHQESEATKHTVFYGFIIVAITFVGLVMVQSARPTYGVFFKPIMTEFGWTRAMTSSAFSVSTALEGIVCVVMGSLTDRFGPRKILTFAGIMLGLGFLLMSQVHSVWQLYLSFGVFIGIGASSTVIPLTSTVLRWFVKRRNTMLGIAQCGGSVGILIWPVIADWLIATYQWRSACIIISVLVFVLLTGLAQLVRRDPSQMGLVPYGTSTTSEKTSRLEEQGKSLKEALTTRQLWQIFTVSFCVGVAFYVTAVHLVPNAIDLGFSATSAARVLSVTGIAMTIGRLTIPPAADIIGSRRILIICFIFMTACFLELSLAREMWSLFLFAVVYGAIEGAMTPLLVPLIARVFGLKSLGALAGFIGLGAMAGAATGPYASGFLFDITGSYQAAFLLCAGMGIIGLVAVLLLKDKPLLDSN